MMPDFEHTTLCPNSQLIPPPAPPHSHTGMNLNSGLEDEENLFNIVSVLSSAGAVGLFMLFVWMATRAGLLTF